MPNFFPMFDLYYLSMRTFNPSKLVDPSLNILLFSDPHQLEVSYSNTHGHIWTPVSTTQTHSATNVKFRNPVSSRIAKWKSFPHPISCLLYHTLCCRHDSSKLYLTTSHLSIQPKCIPYRYTIVTTKRLPESLLDQVHILPLR